MKIELNIEQVKKAFEKKGIEGVLKIKNALYDAALTTSELAMKNLHDNKSVVTGTLVKSFGTQAIKKEKDGMFVTVSTDVEYAPFVEYGTVRMKAKPYFGPAFEVARQQLIKDLK